MPLELFEQLLSALRRENYRVDEIEYCGQGEPLLHPKFSEFVARARSFCPDARQRVITNGNVKYAKATGREGLDEIVVSCDGAMQGSYEKYRIGGLVETALQFMRDVPAYENGIRQNLIWKYVLFEFNDSPDEIQRAQYVAEELGVDTLLFVFTHSKFRSVRWTAATAAELPIVRPNVVTSATPVQHRDRIGLTPHSDWSLSGRHQRGFLYCVDSIEARPDHLDFAGWAWHPKTVSAVDVYLDRQMIGQLRTGLLRPDVRAVHPNCDNQTGFSGPIATPFPASARHEIEIVFRHGSRQLVRIRRLYDLNRSVHSSNGP
jgi:hypothetical protein